MNAIAIYVEGGGDGKGSSHNKRELRQGFDVLFQRQKHAAQSKRLGWQLMPCGSRNQAFHAFYHDLQQADKNTLLVLLVDSEDPIGLETKNATDANAKARVQHLTNRDPWDLATTDPQQVHLMVQCMEAWIVADPEALADFYGKSFYANKLPSRQNLEEEPKPEVLDKLKKATKKTQKGEYAKIKHAAKLLEQIDPAKIAKRCSRFSTVAKWLMKQIEEV
jgi:hypothetical protein